MREKVDEKIVDYLKRAGAIVMELPGYRTNLAMEGVVEIAKMLQLEELNKEEIRLSTQPSQE